MTTNFSGEVYFKGIILYGLNAATYKMAFAKCLFQFSVDGKLKVEWEELAEAFLKQYISRLENNPLPQQNIKNRLAVMERIVKSYKSGAIDYDEAVKSVARDGMNDVVPCFQSIGLKV